MRATHPPNPFREIGKCKPFFILALAIALGATACGPIDEQQDSNRHIATDPSARTNRTSRILRAKEKVPGEYLVLLKDASTMKNGVSASAVHASADRLVTRHGGAKRFVFNRAIRGFSARMSEQAAEALAAEPDVALVEENSLDQAMAIQPSATWGIDRVDQRNLPLNTTYDNRGLTGAGVTVYVIDSGIRTTHQEFEGRASVGIDLVGDGQNGQDPYEHGTHVAGTIAGKTYGVAKQAKVVAVRVLDRDGYSSKDRVIAGIDWVTANHASFSVANMSLGGGESVIQDLAVRNSIASGVVYVLSAGNNHTDVMGSPQRVTEALVVGATDATDTRATFSNFGAGLDLFAPGVRIVSSGNTTNSAIATYNGTSMAAPHVAGLAAIFRQANPTASVAAIHDLVVGASTVGKVKNAGASSPNHLAYIGNDPTVLFSDNFESGSTIQWSPLGGTWAIATDGTKVYRGTNTSGFARAAAGAGAWTDQTIEARVKAVSFSASDRFVFLAGRFVDVNNHYYVALRNTGALELRRVKANATSTLASKAFTVSAGTWYKVKLEIQGTSLKAYVNDTLQLSATDTTFAAGKLAVGAYGAQASFDDVVATPGGSTAVASNPFPATSATGVDTRVVLTWMPGVAATSHDVYFGTSATPPLVANQPRTSYAPANLRNNTTYYWRVNERTSTGAIIQGPVWSFITGSPPGVATVPFPANNATNVGLKPTLTWTPGAGADRHSLYLGTESPPGWLEEIGAANIETDLQHSTKYYWRVDEINGDFITAGPVWTFTTGNPEGKPGYASAPFPALQAHGVSTTPILTWTAGTNAVSHLVYLTTPFNSNGFNGADPALVSTQAGTSYTPGILVAEETYYWRIDERDAQGRITTGKTWSFMTGRPSGLPGLPVNATPADNSAGVALNTTLTWSAASGADSYEIYVNGGNPEAEGGPRIYSTTQTSYRLPTLTADQGYTWCVVAKNAVAKKRGLWTSFNAIGDPSVPAPTSGATSPTPANNATGINANPTLAWTLPTSATTGLVYFGLSATTLQFVEQRDASYFASNLQGNTKYFWRVDALNDGGVKTGPVWSFTTGAPVAPQPPSSPTPANGSTGIDPSVSLTWTSGQGAFRQRIFFGITPLLNEVGTTDPDRSYSEIPQLEPFTKYYWRVDQENATGITTGPVWTFTTGAEPPLPASNPSPADAASNVSTTPTLTWSPVPGATSYEVFLAADPDPAVSVSIQAGTTFRPSRLTSGTLYLWRVNALTSFGEIIGQDWSFTTGADGTLGRALNPSPTNGESDVSTNSMLTFTASAGAVQHDVYLSLDNTEQWKKLSTQTGTVVNPGLLFAGATYYWRIDERDSRGNVMTGQAWRFNTAMPTNIPGVAVNPKPTDYATLVGTALNLTWTAGAGTTAHLVYFGPADASGSIPLVATQTGTSYNPGALTPDTNYSWFIGERNANGITRGPMWTFTTGTTTGTPPEPARTPSPEHNALGVTVTPVLTWTSGPGASSHDVYFGASYPPAFVGNRTTASHTPGTLLPYTTYFWRADQRNSAGVRPGVTWQFSTGAAGTVTPTPLFGDNFEDSNSNGWTLHGGTWSVVTDGTKSFRGVNTSGYARASAGTSSWTNQKVEARVRPVSWSGSDRFALLAARFVDINNYYYIALRSSGVIELKRLKANAATTLASKALTVSAGTWYKVRLEVVGTTLKAYVNDTLQLSATDTSFAAGKIAVGAYYGTVSFDDIVVTQ